MMVCDEFLVAPEYADMDEDLDYWVNLALICNPKAKSNKKL
jgi:hypothetical protein